MSIRNSRAVPTTLGLAEDVLAEPHVNHTRPTRRKISAEIVALAQNRIHRDTCRIADFSDFNFAYNPSCTYTIDGRVLSAAENRIRFGGKRVFDIEDLTG